MSNYKKRHVLGLQRSGTNFLDALISENFECTVDKKPRFWKHLTPYGVKEEFLQIIQDPQRDKIMMDPNLYNSNHLTNLRNDVFYVCISKDYNTWIQSIKRMSAEFYKSHNLQTVSNPERDIYNTWHEWLNACIDKRDNIYYNTYKNYLVNTENCLREIQQKTNWKLKNSTYVTSIDYTVAKNKHFDISNYDHYFDSEIPLDK